MGQEGKHGLTRVNIRIKMVIIIVLKFNSGVDLGQGPNHYLGGSTLVFLGQHNKKNYYHHSLETILWGQSRARFGSRVIRVNLGQCMDKNSYYHSFKT